MPFSSEDIKKLLASSYPDFNIDEVDSIVWPYLASIINRRSYFFEFILLKFYQEFGDQVNITSGQVVSFFANYQ